MTQSVMESSDVWKKCNSCKKAIPFRQTYYTCNVSTCNRKRTGLVFCEVSCWDAHVPLMNHRESWAEEHIAPSPEEWAKILYEDAQPKKRTKHVPDKEMEEKAETATVSSAPKTILRKSRT